MKRIISALLLAYLSVGCSDKTDEIANDESYFVGQWSMSPAQPLISYSGQPFSGSALYDFKKDGKLTVDSGFVIAVDSGLPSSGSGTLVLTPPELLWSYVENSKMLLLFTPQKATYDVIQTDKNTFTAIDVETGIRIVFSRK